MNVRLMNFRTNTIVTGTSLAEAVRNWEAMDCGLFGPDKPERFDYRIKDPAPGETSTRFSGNYPDGLADARATLDQIASNGERQAAEWPDYDIRKEVWAERVQELRSLLAFEEGTLADLVDRGLVDPPFVLTEGERITRIRNSSEFFATENGDMFMFPRPVAEPL